MLLIGHGTRDDVGSDQFFQLASLLAARLVPTPVQPALLEFREPTIAQAWDALVARGVSQICVAPLLLFAAGHAKQDIPDLVKQCQSRTPGVSFDQSRPLSRHPAMVRLVLQRLTETLDRSPRDAEGTAVVMVGRGSHDPCAQADMRVLTEIVSRRIGAAKATTAYYAMAEPRVPSVLEDLASSGRFHTIVVNPHLLFEGRLFQAIVCQMEEARTRHPRIHWTHSNYLGPDPLVAEAIAARVERVKQCT